VLTFTTTPCGWSTGFMTLPRTRGRIPRWRIDRFAETDEPSIRIGNGSDRRRAGFWTRRHLAGGKFQLGEFTFDRHDLGGIAGAVDHFTTGSRRSSMSFTSKPIGTCMRGMRFADFAFNFCQGRQHALADFEVGGRQNVALLTVLVVQEGDTALRFGSYSIAGNDSRKYRICRGGNRPSGCCV